MLTFNQGYNRAIDITGVQSTSSDVVNLKADINQGLRLLKNAARRYWTRQSKTANLVANQQFYQLPSDVVRVSEVTVTANGLVFPLKEVSSESKWNQLNIIPAVTINVPTYYFVRGYNEIGLWPTPSFSQTSGLNVAYEPRMADMSLDDVTSATGVFVNGDTTITDASAPFNEAMVGRWLNVTDGTDGYWYKIATFTSTSEIDIENSFMGVSGTRTYLIGQVPDVPEDYHMAGVYYAAYNFFLKRKDSATATMYYNMFKELRDQYKSTYANKSTGIVKDDISRLKYSIFSVPPNTMV